MKTLLSRAALAAAAMTLGLSGAAALTTSGTLSVTLNVTASCSVATGSSITFSQNAQQIGANGQSTISVTCTSGLPYSIGLGNGLRPSRKLQGAGGATVDYELFSDDARSISWGNTATDSVPGTGTGASQSFPVYINAYTLATTAAGTYTDNVQITVSY